MWPASNTKKKKIKHHKGNNMKRQLYLLQQLQLKLQPSCNHAVHGSFTCTSTHRANWHSLRPSTCCVYNLQQLVLFSVSKEEIIGQISVLFFLFFMREGKSKSELCHHSLCRSDLGLQIPRLRAVVALVEAKWEMSLSGSHHQVKTFSLSLLLLQVTHKRGAYTLTLTDTHRLYCP